MERKTVNLELEGGNQLLQKYLAKKASDYAELDFETNIATYTGFVTGLDEKWVRITESRRDGTAGTFNAILIKIDNICAMSETGRHLRDLSAKEATRVRAFSGLFVKASQGEMSRLHDARGDED